MTATETPPPPPRHRHPHGAPGGPAPLLTGEARYTDDLVIPGALHLAVLRSPYAHARITLDRHRRAARGLPGVVAVFTGADLADLWASPMPCAWPVTEDMKNPPHYPLAIEHRELRRRRRGGRAGHDATPRPGTRSRPSSSTTTRSPAVVDLEDAPQRPGARARGARHQHVATRWELKIGDEAAGDQAFADAAHTVKERYVQQRLIAMAMEPRACAAVPQPFGGDLTLYCATQIPHILKVMVAITLGIPEHQLRVVAPSVGGGFGSKLDVYAEELLCAGAGPQASACRCAGSRSAPRTPRPPSRAAARSRTSSWPPTPTASSPPSG